MQTNDDNNDDEKVNLNDNADNAQGNDDDDVDDDDVRLQSLNDTVDDAEARAEAIIREQEEFERNILFDENKYHAERAALQV